MFTCFVITFSNYHWQQMLIIQHCCRTLLWLHPSTLPEVSSPTISPYLPSTKPTSRCAMLTAFSGVSFLKYSCFHVALASQHCIHSSFPWRPEQAPGPKLVSNAPVIHLLILVLYICVWVLCAVFVFAHLSYLLPLSFLFSSYLTYLLPSRIGPLISRPDVIGGNKTWFLVYCVYFML